MSETEKLQAIIKHAPDQSIVFFGGAGVSTESGIPDFRSPDGLYNQKYEYSPEVMVSRSFFDRRMPEFFDFYFDRMIFSNAQPNQAHKKLVELEEEGKLISVVTQNIDGLHQAAGSKNVLELHGSVLRNYCMDCGAAYDLDQMLALRREAVSNDEGVPRCSRCGGVVKPDVVLYEESLDSAVLEQAMHDIARADTLIIAGTSLVVNPAASLIRFFNGDNLAIVNLSPTPADSRANLVITCPVGEVFDF